MHCQKDELLLISGAVIKMAEITGFRLLTGKAVCFDGQPHAIVGRLIGKMKVGDVVVVRNGGLVIRRC